MNKAPPREEYAGATPEYIEDDGDLDDPDMQFMIEDQEAIDSQSMAEQQRNFGMGHSSIA